MSDDLEQRTFGNVELARKMLAFARSRGERPKVIRVTLKYLPAVQKFCEDIEKAHEATKYSTLNFRYSA